MEVCPEDGRDWKCTVVFTPMPGTLILGCCHGRFAFVDAPHGLLLEMLPQEWFMDGEPGLGLHHNPVVACGDLLGGCQRQFEVEPQAVAC